MKTEHQQVREALGAAAASCRTSRNGSKEFIALVRLSHLITPEGAAKLRALLK